MKSLFFGIVLIIVVGFGGLVYRNAVEHPSRPITCPLDAKTCPDGTSVSRTGNSCMFAACPPPNVSLPDIAIAYAVPDGFVATAVLPDAASVVAYEAMNVSTSSASIIVRRYAILASSTALMTIQQTAIGAPSGAPVPATAFSSVILETHRFTVVAIERFEGVVDTAYYLARSTDVLRFDAIDRDVMNWTNPNLAVSALPANAALQKMLSTLEGG
ncbi:TPA: hypothetical protein DIV48_03810 [Candidatus Kaiserbacteria bacterium]|nr:MAG: hypothetical protein UY93_C0004G0040 [Parcubacteria group bacterium GW2011_GWA1_56_13]KKW47033.1 MAG: hypothetical protein UY97_C0001G0090 [Parcubacteria group bacterium GW2011_GWB1_57_6]HCR52738.1 hypothetical protein [Candidatus Kaiserbacteria bacterium]